MVSDANRVAENPAIPVVAGTFVLLAAIGWFAIPGVSLAIGYYGAVLVSEQMCRVWSTSASRTQRLGAVAGLILAWLVVLGYAAATLPSNFSAALI